MPLLDRTNRRAAWQDAARLTGGTFEAGKRKGKDRVTLSHGPWTITLDTYAVHTGQSTQRFTRVRAFFVGTGDLRLLIRRRWFGDRLLEFLGLRGVTPSNRQLADRYVVRGVPENRARRLTSDLATVVLDQPSLRLEIKPAPRKYRRRMGDGTRLVTARTSGIVKDAERLTGLIAVVRTALDALVTCGEAAREPVREADGSG